MGAVRQHGGIMWDLEDSCRKGVGFLCEMVVLVSHEASCRSGVGCVLLYI